jgi:predicted DCC family thiol-disulfide oxidoreductase YuxK
MLLRFREYLSEDRFLIGASLLRICIGLLLIYHYLIHYGQRYFLWSGAGINDYSEQYLLSTLSLYNMNSSLIYFDIIYHISIVASVVYLIGYKGRIISVINYVLYYSLYIRMGHISDGGDNLLVICLFFLLFVNCTVYFAPKAELYRASRHQSKHTFRAQLGSLLHNAAVICIVIQLCFVYFISAMYQMMGELWQNGTAIYYISQVNEFSRPILRKIVDDFLWLTVMASYMSVIIKLGFPFTLWNKRLKPVMVGAMLIFHAGIGIGMGLLTFSLTMIVMELLVFTDQEYRSARALLVRAYQNAGERFRVSGSRIGEKHLSSWKVVVFFDGWCPVCQGIMKQIERLDWFELIESKSFRDHAIMEKYGLKAEEVERRMHSQQVGANRMCSGIASVEQIMKRLLPLWPAVPLIMLSRWIGLGSVAYDYIADRRKLIPVNHCDSQCEIG